MNRVKQLGRTVVGVGGGLALIAGLAVGAGAVVRNDANGSVVTLADLVGGTSSSSSSSSTTAGSTTTPTVPTSVSGATTAPTSATVAPSVATTAASTSSTAAGSSSSSSSSSVADPVVDGERTIDLGEAGTVTVSVIDGRLELVNVTANPGWTVAKQRVEGDEIKVELTNGSDRVRAEIEIEDGRLEVEVKGAGRDDDDDEDDDDRSTVTSTGSSTASTIDDDDDDEEDHSGKGRGGHDDDDDDRGGDRGGDDD